MSPRKSMQDTSNQWKDLVLACLVIGNHLAWNIGNEEHIRIVFDFVLGCGEANF